MRRDGKRYGYKRKFNIAGGGGGGAIAFHCVTEWEMKWYYLTNEMILVFFVKSNRSGETVNTDFFFCKAFSLLISFRWLVCLTVKNQTFEGFGDPWNIVCLC